MAIRPATKTAQEVADNIKRQFGDESGSQITDTDIIRWINEGQLELARANKLFATVATTVTVADQSQYDLPSLSIVSIEAMNYDGKPLEYRTFNSVQELLLRDPDNSAAASDKPLIWYEYGDSIFLYPAPKTAGVEIKLFYSKQPTTIVSLSDTLSIPDIYFKALVTYILREAYELDDDWAASKFKAQQLDAAITELDDESASEKYYPTITVMLEDM